MNLKSSSSFSWCVLLCILQINLSMTQTSTSSRTTAANPSGGTTATSSSFDASSLVLDCSEFANTSNPSMKLMGWEARLQACFDANPYDIRHPPLPIGVELLQLTFDYNVMYIISLEHDQISFFGQMVLSWPDYYRHWDTKQIPLRSIQVPVSTIWYPQFLFSSTVTKRSYKLIEPEDTAVITRYYTAIVRRNMLEGRCDMNYSNFPFDTQTCSLEFLLDRIYFFNYDVMALRENFTYVFGNFTNEEWELISITALAFNLSFNMYTVGENGGATKDLYMRVEDQQTGFVVNITLRRFSQFYLINIGAPIIILSVMGQTSFALPEHCEGKIVVPLTVLLGFMFIQDIVSKELPHSENMPRIAVYVFSCVALTAINCLTSALLVFIAHTNCRMPRALRTAVRWLSFPIFPSRWLTCCRSGSRCSSSSSSQHRTLNNSASTSAEASINDIDLSLQPITSAAHDKHMSDFDKEEKHKFQPWQPLATYLNRLFAITHLAAVVLLFVGIVLPILYE